MKSLQTLSQLLLLFVCASPLLAEAHTTNYHHANYHYNQTNFNDGTTQQNAASCCNDNGFEFLQPTGENADLDKGNYLFGQVESSFNKSFSDDWTFSVDENSQATLSFLNIGQMSIVPKLLSTSNLSLDLFDSNNNSLGSIVYGQSLNLLLAANTTYSLVVSGSAQGLLGGLYLGKLQLCPTPAAVPIGNTFSMFAASLLLLGWQVRQRMRA